MKRINCMLVLSLLLLASNSEVMGQTTTPYYDNIRKEKELSPLHKIKHALIDNSPTRETQFNRSFNNWAYNNRIGLFKPVTQFEQIGELHKVKLDYVPKPNMGLLYNKFKF